MINYRTIPLLWAILTLMPIPDVEFINTWLLTKLIHFPVGANITIWGVTFNLWALILQYVIAVIVLYFMLRR